MKEAEKIIKCSESWFNKDQKNRTAVVILADRKESDVWGFSKGTTSKIAHLIHTLMIENKRSRSRHIYSCLPLCTQAHYSRGARRDKCSYIRSR